MTEGYTPNSHQAPPDLIKDASIETFAEDVIAASGEVPVIVDFWAPWCGPCKQLTPALEKVVTEARGAVKLVKINVDENQALAAQLRIQSIPTIYAFKGGQPVDGFAGALPESQIKAFVEKLTGPMGPAPADELVAVGETALEAGDFGSAEQAFGAAHGRDPDHAGALAGLVKTYTAMGELDRASQVLQMVPADTLNDPLITGARAALELEQTAAEVDTSEIDALKAKAEANPKDMESRLALAEALMAAHKREEAFETALDMVADDRKWNDEAARKLVLNWFEALGPTHELTLAGRRRLSSILFS
ncbi:MAG: thioredoxin [Alphaproteobacteria bacterium]|nr:MAG: thioredoxin [Alphaproteobacteria bacterium]